MNIRDKYDLVGDVTLDFKIDEDDITDLKDYLAPDKTFQFTQPVQEHYCDLNADGVIDDADVAYLENVIYGKITITEQPKNLTQSIHSRIRLSVTAQGEDLRYEWYSSNDDHTGFNIEVSDTKKRIDCHVKTPTLSFPMTYDRIGQEIYCVITDKYNHKVKTETITLQATNPINVTSLSSLRP